MWNKHSLRLLAISKQKWKNEWWVPSCEPNFVFWNLPTRLFIASYRNQTINPRRVAINYMLSEKEKRTVGYLDAVYFDLVTIVLCVYKKLPRKWIKSQHKSKQLHEKQKKVLQIDTVLKLKKNHKNSKVKRKIEYDYLMDICKANWIKKSNY